MKVIHYIASIDKAGGGTTEYMRLLSTALKTNITISIATAFSLEPIAIDGIQIQFFKSSISQWFSMMKEFEVFLKKEQPDLVHINGIWSPQNWGFQKVAQNLDIKVILSPHGMLEPWIMANNPWKKRLGLFLYQKKAIIKADYLHATAQIEVNSMRSLGFKNPIVMIPNGIDLSAIKGVKKDYGTKKMVFLSRIHPKKGIELLLQAWRNTTTSGWILEIAGNGDDKYIRVLTESAADLPNVYFVGAKYGEDKWNFLRSADVMVLPTYSENFGIVVAESLAVGVPVITTKGTPWEDLETNQCGWWIDLSIRNLQEYLQKVFKATTANLEDMGTRGISLVADKYEINAVASEMIQLYKKVLNGK
jgi:glycosyltransferase involved in cell wall biosynthesis